MRLGLLGERRYGAVNPLVEPELCAVRVKPLLLLYRDVSQRLVRVDVAEEAVPPACQFEDARDLVERLHRVGERPARVRYGGHGHEDRLATADRIVTGRLDVTRRDRRVVKGDVSHPAVTLRCAQPWW